MPSRQTTPKRSPSPRHNPGVHTDPQQIARNVHVTNGGVRIVVFDPQLAIRREFEWTGQIQHTPANRGDSVFADILDEDIELWPPKIPPNFGEDKKLLGGGPIELTPSGPRQPAEEDRPRPPEEPRPEDSRPPALGPPIDLDPWGHIPPVFPLPPWFPEFDLESPKPHELDFFSTWNPCDLFHPYGPFGPFVEPPTTIELIFPRVPWLGPYQPPLERALFEGLEEFLKEMGKAGSEGTIHGDDWEKASRSAAQKAAKALWDYIKDRLVQTQFGGDFNFESVCEFARRRPWLTGIGVTIVAGGYGLFLGDQYRRKGKIKVDFGDFEFEYDGETGDWSAGFRFKFKF